MLRDVTDRQTRRLELEDELALEKSVGDVSRQLLEIAAGDVDVGRYRLGNQAVSGLVRRASR